MQSSASFSFSMEPSTDSFITTVNKNTEAFKCRFAGISFLLWELSTPFVHARWLMHHLHMEHTKIYFINGLLMLISFFSVRCVYGIGTFVLERISRRKIVFSGFGGFLEAIAIAACPSKRKRNAFVGALDVSCFQRRIKCFESNMDVENDRSNAGVSKNQVFLVA